MSKQEAARSELETLISVGIHDVRKLMKMTGKSRATIFRMKKRLKNSEGAQRRPGSGRPPILSANDKRRISCLARKNNHWSSEQIAKVAHKKGSSLVSKWTVLRYLKSRLLAKWDCSARPFHTQPSTFFF